jgi:hypothetical protein
MSFRHQLECPSLPFNVQAVNFVPADWLRYGAASMLRYRSFRKPSVLCHEELLLRVVREGSPVAAFWAARELERAVRDEARLRYHLWACVRSRSPSSFIIIIVISPFLVEPCAKASSERV